jgi:hypothetical protein
MEYWSNWEVVRKEQVLKYNTNNLCSLDQIVCLYFNARTKPIYKLILCFFFFCFKHFNIDHCFYIAIISCMSYKMARQENNYIKSTKFCEHSHWSGIIFLWLWITSPLFQEPNINCLPLSFIVSNTWLQILQVVFTLYLTLKALFANIRTLKTSYNAT